MKYLAGWSDPAALRPIRLGPCEPIRRAIADDARKHRANGPDRRAVVTQQTMYLGIGIVNGNVEPAQPLGGDGLAHADRSREP